jgi:protein-tyrosine phosphatase
MAEGIARKFGLIAFSRGVIASEGLGADPNAVAVCAENGIDISNHTSTTLKEEDFQLADYILCMETKHIEYIKRRFPFYAHKSALLGSFCGVGEIEDPIGGSIEKYRETFKKIRTSIEKFVEKIRSGHSECAF